MPASTLLMSPTTTQTRWSGKIYFFAISLALSGRQGHRFLGERVVVVFRQAVFQDVAIGAAELLHGLKVAGQS